MTVQIKVIITYFLVGIGCIAAFCQLNRGKTLSMTSVETFVAVENGARGAANLPLYYAGVTAGQDSAIGFQSATLPAGQKGAVVLDNDRSTYALSVDATGILTVKDLSTTDASAGQTITVTGENYLVFKAALNTGGIYDELMIVASGGDSTVAKLYQSTFGRLPDLPGLEAWEHQYDAGLMSLQQIAAAFGASGEFQTRYGSNTTDGQYVDALYTNVLGRSADKAGETAWVSYLGSQTAANGATAARATVLLDFATSQEETTNAASWLIDTSKGGYADAGQPLSASTVISQGDANHYIDLNNTAAPTTTVYSSDATLNPYGVVTQGSQIYAPGHNNFPSAELVTAISNATIIASSTVPMVAATGSNVTIYGSSSATWIGINSTTDKIVVGSGQTTITIGGMPSPGGTVPLTIQGFKVGSDVYQDITSDSHADASVSVGYVYNAAQILNASAGQHISGAGLTFNPSTYGTNNPIYVLELGSVGGGAAAEVAAVANTVYSLAGSASEHFVIIGQVTQTSTVASAGDTIIYDFAEIKAAGGIYQAADLNGNHAIDANELTLQAKLIGVTTTSLTHADFGGGQ